MNFIHHNSQVVDEQTRSIWNQFGQAVAGGGVGHLLAHSFVRHRVNVEHVFVVTTRESLRPELNRQPISAVRLSPSTTNTSRALS